MGLRDLAEQRSEGQLVRVGGVVLVPQEYHPVPEQGGAQFSDRRRLDVAADADAADDAADQTAYLRNLDVLEVVVPGQAYRTVAELSHVPRPLIVASSLRAARFG